MIKRQHKYIAATIAGILAFEYLVSESITMDSELIKQLGNTRIEIILGIAIVGLVVIGYRAFGFAERLILLLSNKLNEITSSINNFLNTSNNFQEKNVGILAVIADHLREAREETRISKETTIMVKGLLEDQKIQINLLPETLHKEFLPVTQKLEDLHKGHAIILTDISEVKQLAKDIHAKVTPLIQPTLDQTTPASETTHSEKTN